MCPDLRSPLTTGISSSTPNIGILFGETWTRHCSSTPGKSSAGSGDIPGNRFHTGGGVGIHLLGTRGPRFRFEVAFSQENTRIILTAGPAF